MHNNFPISLDRKSLSCKHDNDANNETYKDKEKLDLY